MIVYIQRKIQKDRDRISDTSVMKSFSDFIRLLQQEQTLRDIPHIKKIQGGKNYYRYRIGEYRVGFRVAGDTLYIERILHRKDIYKVFP